MMHWIYRYGLLAAIVYGNTGYAGLDPTYSLKLTTGVFGSSSADNRGVVMPWKVDAGTKVKPDDKTTVELKLATESGIKVGEGPYVSPFSNSDPKSLKIGSISYNRKLSESAKLAVALGRVRANILSKGQNSSPFPFSQAVNKLPVLSSDFAAGLQLPVLLDNHFFSVGTAVDKISSSTNSDERTHSLFLESYYDFDPVGFWVQFSRNNLSQTYSKDHYFLVGIDRDKHGHNASSAIAFNSNDGLVGVNFGYKLHVPIIDSSSAIGLAYAFKKDKNKTVELSFDQNIFPSLAMVMSVYYQKPIKTTETITTTKGYFVGGVRLVQTLLK